MTIALRGHVGHRLLMNAQFLTDKGGNKIAVVVPVARFVNWLNTSNGHSAAYKFTLQPGEAGYSSNANIELWMAGDAGFDAANPYRNLNAFYFLPSEDEWHKAAYYSGSDTTYYDYATASDTIPAAVADGTANGTAVFRQEFSTGPADIDNAGGLSHYGAMGQSGNVFEWNESAFDGINDSSSETRGIRGGSWSNTESFLRALEPRLRRSAHARDQQCRVPRRQCP